jgi:plastocyanin
MRTRHPRNPLLARLAGAASAIGAAAALLLAGAAPAAAADCGADAMVQPFVDHIDVAHLERSPMQQANDILHLDSYVLAHTTLVDAMLAPLPPTLTAALEPFEQHVYSAHLERSPMQQVHDLLHLDDYLLAHTVLVESMLKPLLSGCSDGGTGGSAPPTMSHGGMAPAPALAPAAAPVAIAIRGYAFDPHAVTVPIGTAVTWTNDDQDPHTVTGSGLRSSSLGTGASFSYTFSRAGTYRYSCALHPQMKGTVTVA